MLVKSQPKLIPMTKEQEELCIQFVLDFQNGFLPLKMTVEAIKLTLKCSMLEAMQVFKFLKN